MGASHVHVSGQWEDFCFLMKVRSGGGLCAARSYA